MDYIIESSSPHAPVGVVFIQTKIDPTQFYDQSQLKTSHYCVRPRNLVFGAKDTTFKKKRQLSIPFVFSNFYNFNHSGGCEFIGVSVDGSMNGHEVKKFPKECGQLAVAIKGAVSIECDTSQFDKPAYGDIIVAFCENSRRACKTTKEYTYCKLRNIPPHKLYQSGDESFVTAIDGDESIITASDDEFFDAEDQSTMNISDIGQISNVQNDASDQGNLNAGNVSTISSVQNEVSDQSHLDSVTELGEGNISKQDIPQPLTNRADPNGNASFYYKINNESKEVILDNNDSYFFINSNIKYHNEWYEKVHKMKSNVQQKINQLKTYYTDVLNNMDKNLKNTLEDNSFSTFFKNLFKQDENKNKSNIKEQIKSINAVDTVLQQIINKIDKKIITENIFENYKSEREMMLTYVEQYEKRFDDIDGEITELNTTLGDELSVTKKDDLTKKIDEKKKNLETTKENLDSSVITVEINDLIFDAKLQAAANSGYLCERLLGSINDGFYKHKSKVFLNKILEIIDIFGKNVAEQVDHYEKNLKEIIDEKIEREESENQINDQTEYFFNYMVNISRILIDRYKLFIEKYNNKSTKKIPDVDFKIHLPDSITLYKDYSEIEDEEKQQIEKFTEYMKNEIPQWQKDLQGTFIEATSRAKFSRNVQPSIDSGPSFIVGMLLEFQHDNIRVLLKQ